MVKLLERSTAAEEAPGETWGIADLAADFETTARAIRFYEAEGLLTPWREGQRRIYRRRDRTRLRLILRGKRLGISLAEIREIIDIYRAPPGEAGQLQLLIDKIDERRKELLEKRRDIDQALAELETVEANCRDRLGQIGTRR